MAVTVVSRISGALSNTAACASDANGAQTFPIVTSGAAATGVVLANGPLKDLLTRSYSAADATAAQIAALAAFNANIRITIEQSGTTYAGTLIGYAVSASAANPSVLTLAAKATVAANATEQYQVTVQYAPSATK